ncbi:helix-turn-helix domain-containing protein [Paracraurococcus ruber]|uniref:HTH araC/xylS-type domain-containing protein n=1 Tax=Paracraurococcus ruber TaxID=77675 RepID=A0ABS1CSL7_9PROT|nr:helix-turn-helix transcriptional regulator [Paracraurococcus ruber]MBK1657462.1 hypothetical protein [Paracraurococcus ruber]TDG32974.1 AraC family transcriptional regulator [Paracraurococcus ruber]
MERSLSPAAALIDRAMPVPPRVQDLRLGDLAGRTAAQGAAPGWHLLCLLREAGQAGHAVRVGRDILRFRADAGLLLLLPAGQPRGWQLGGPGQEEAIAVSIAPDWLAALAASEGLPPAAAALPARILRGDPFVTCLLRSFDAYAAAGSIEALFSAHWATLLALRLLRLPPAPLPAPSHAIAPWRMVAVTAGLAGRPAPGIDVAALAARARLSPSHFSRAFRQETGLPPQAWLMRQRLAAARRLLTTTAWPMHRIAAEAGFSSPAAMRACFLREIGCTPSDYRKSADG